MVKTEERLTWMTLVTSACLPPVRKVTVNDERRGEDFKAQTPFI